MSPDLVFHVYELTQSFKNKDQPSLTQSTLNLTSDPRNRTGRVSVSVSNYVISLSNGIRP